ncbi:hypothetical protein [Streptomyces sp. NPDC050287]|uniref:hypothetical protein n=1 Tax=Streptomyces sp. NPDC050287 TaxID=3365608 RepID=UPI0037A04A41
MSTVRSLPRSRAWLRVLVLLLAVLVPGTHAAAHAAPVASLEIVEYDVLDAAATTAVRPPATAVRRAAVPLRPVPLPAPAPGAPEGGRPLPAPPVAPYAARALRSVVLRC